MNQMWTTHPIIPTEWITLIAVLLLAGACLRFLRERRGNLLRGRVPLLLRLTVIVLLVCIFLNPSKMLVSSNKEKAELVIMLDTSASMATGDVNGKSRFQTSVDTLLNPKTVQRLEKSFHLKLLRFDRTVQIVPRTALPSLPDGSGTNLAKALRAGIKQIRTPETAGGIVLISDGRATDAMVQDAAMLALAKSIPIWTLCLGSQVPRKDVRIETDTDEVLAFSNTKTILAARIVQSGYPHRSFKIDLVKEGRLIASREVLPNEQGIGQVFFNVPAPREGEHRYVLQTAPQEQEVDTWNNERTVYIKSVGEKVNILLAEGQPHWDTKFLVQMLKRHERVNLTAVYALRGDRYTAIVSRTGDIRRESGNLFPKDRESFMQYDVVIFGRQGEIFFTKDTEALLTEFVARRGRGLIFSRAKAYSGRFHPLSKFDPVIWEKGLETNVPLQYLPSDGGPDLFGRNISAALTNGALALPNFDQVMRTRGTKPLAMILGVGPKSEADKDDQNILLAYQRYGKGRVVAVNATGLWRWAFNQIPGTADKQVDIPEGDARDVYTTFWMSFIRWLLATSDLMPGMDVAVEADRRYYSEDDRVTLNVFFRAPPSDSYKPILEIKQMPQARVVQSIQTAKPSTAGHFETVVGPFPPGTYSVNLKNPPGTGHPSHTFFDVAASSEEYKELSSNPELMQSLADFTDGKVLLPADMQRLPAIIKAWHRDRQLADQQHSIWDRWWLIVLIFGLLFAEGYLRRREDLL